MGNRSPHLHLGSSQPRGGEGPLHGEVQEQCHTLGPRTHLWALASTALMVWASPWTLKCMILSLRLSCMALQGRTGSSFRLLDSNLHL